MKTLNTPANTIYIFLDGVGIGAKNTDSNPFTKYSNGFFSVLGGGESFKAGGYLVPTDAHMGIDGLPQSATGQTALFTGYNGSQIMGRHVTGFPTFSLRPYLKQKSILRVFEKNGKRATLLNSYAEKYLKRIFNKRTERMLSASSHAQRSTGKPFFNIEDYLEGRSMYMDITNWFLRSFHKIDIPMADPKKQGRKLVGLSKDYDLILYEYFFTDKVGHSQSQAAAKRILRHVEEFLEGVYEELDTENQLLIVSSDHGNIEDLSTKRHTNNEVPTIIYGKGADCVKDNIQYLYDIPREILRLYDLDFDKDPVLTAEKQIT